MQFVTNLFLLALRLKTTSGLKVIDSGIGLAEYGAEEKIGDYAVLASDQKASLPTQVHGLGLGCRTKCSQNASIARINSFPHCTGFLFKLGLPSVSRKVNSGVKNFLFPISMKDKTHRF